MEAAKACNSIRPLEVDASLASSPCFSGRSAFSLRLPAGAHLNAGYLYLAIRSGQANSRNAAAAGSLPPSAVHFSREKYIAPKFEVALIQSPNSLSLSLSIRTLSLSLSIRALFRL
jgi:hypothetical protein